MLRRLHSLPGLTAALIVCFMTITGAILSLDPIIAHFRSGPAVAPSTSVAALASRVADNFNQPDRLVKTAAGSVIVYYRGQAGKAADTVDPQTGVSTGTSTPSGFFGFMTELHRSMFAGTAGHAIAGIAAFSMLVLSISGSLLLVARLGGWRQLLKAARGTVSQRLHVELGRIAVLGLLLTALTGAYMSLASFGVIASGASGLGGFPANVDGGQPQAISRLAALEAIPLTDLRELVFPAADDPTDVFTVTTNAGQGYVDQATGKLLSFTPNGLAQTIYEAFYTLHTGQGIWWLAALLGLTALCVPTMAATGITVWWLRQRNQPRLAGNVAAHAADTIILVGSEGNSTWGFASTLHNALTKAGYHVHTGPMNALALHYDRAERVFVLTATYGDGTAPASATRFLSRVPALKLDPSVRFAVLGFGDKRFAHFCRYASEVEAALLAKGCAPLRSLARIDRQSSQAFAHWGTEIGKVLATPLHLAHKPARHRTQALVLAERTDYGHEVQAPTSILRFVAPLRKPSWRQYWPMSQFEPLPRFEAGDLVAILPPGSDTPRYYSLASASRDGVLEICVRKQRGGLCSEFLHELEVGSTIEAFIEHNPAFRPAKGQAPVIMIGAGTGIAPFVGFIARNRRRRPMHLYWGGRDPRSDFLYEDVIADGLRDARLSRVVTAFSRIVGGSYVQEKVRADAALIASLVANGAQIMVCGGKEMAQGVMAAVDEAITPLGSSVVTLKAQGRYVEDVY